MSKPKELFTREQLVAQRDAAMHSWGKLIYGMALAKMSVEKRAGELFVKRLDTPAQHVRQMAIDLDREIIEKNDQRGQILANYQQRIYALDLKAAKGKGRK